MVDNDLLPNDSGSFSEPTDDQKNQNREHEERTMVKSNPALMKLLVQWLDDEIKQTDSIDNIVMTDETSEESIKTQMATQKLLKQRLQALQGRLTSLRETYK